MPALSAGGIRAEEDNAVENDMTAAVLDEDQEGAEMHKITDLCSEFSFRKDRLGSYPWLMERPGERKRVNIIGLGDV